MTECKPAKTPVALGVKLVAKELDDRRNDLPYRELTGTLMYLVIGTSPNIGYAVTWLSQFINSHELLFHWIAAKRVSQYLKGSIEQRLVFRKDDRGVSAFADADYGGCIID